jgi:hypothetical protein
MPFLGALLMSCTQQRSGINAVFYHSGDIFLDAGIDDSCIETLIIDFIKIWSTFFTGVLSTRFGNRNMIGRFFFGSPADPVLLSEQGFSRLYY